jgi:glutathione S-transferase
MLSSLAFRSVRTILQEPAPMSIVFFEYPPTRSSRVSWTLAELDLGCDRITGRELMGSQRLRAVHPLAKLPAITDNDRPLFESAAICTWLCDSHADRGLVAASGTWERALHDQWVAFALSELEAYLWSSARNTFVYPEGERIEAVFAQNDMEAKRALKALDDHLATTGHMVGDRFSVTDIIVGFTVNWARRAGLTQDFANLGAYMTRLLERPHCPYPKD